MLALNCFGFQPSQHPIPPSFLQVSRLSVQFPGCVWSVRVVCHYQVFQAGPDLQLYINHNHTLNKHLLDCCGPGNARFCSIQIEIDRYYYYIYLMLERTWSLIVLEYFLSSKDRPETTTPSLVRIWMEMKDNTIYHISTFEQSFRSFIYL